MTDSMQQYLNNLVYNSRYLQRQKQRVKQKNPENIINTYCNCYFCINAQILRTQQNFPNNYYLRRLAEEEDMKKREAEYWEREIENVLEENTRTEIDDNYDLELDYWVRDVEINSDSDGEIISETESEIQVDDFINYENVPTEYLCPITMSIMKDPVICEDGYTYEKSAIILVRNSISPMTRQKINLTKLIPNRALKNLIDRFKEQSEKDLSPEQIKEKEIAKLGVDILNKFKKFKKKNKE